MKENSQKYQPPTWADRFLQWFCAPELLEEVQGDVYEVFIRRCKTKNLRKARLGFILDVFRFFNYSTIKGNRKYFQINPSTVMLKNYLKVSFRILVKEKLYTAVNLSGLSIALACAILIALFVKDEWSYDQFHEKSDQIYRAWVKEDHGNNEIYFNTTTPIVLGQTIRNTLPEASEVVRIAQVNTLISKKDFSDNQQVLLAEKGFFELFDFKEIEGDRSNFLLHPGQVILSENAAEKYFGDEKVLGTLINIDLNGEKIPFKIVGIIENAPYNSSITYEFIIPYSNYEKGVSKDALENWYSVSVETYVKINESSSPALVCNKIEGTIKSLLADNYPQNGYMVGLQPLTDIHLNSDMPQGFAEVSDWKYSYILGTIALFILLVAAINFMTLSIGRSLSRAKEVGVRKSIGAKRKQIVMQYWSEALLTTFLAMLSGLILASFCLPIFNSFTSKQLAIEPTLENILILLGIATFTGLISGIYPALILSRFTPVAVLKGSLGKLTSGKGNDSFRKIMVSFQFVISVMLVSGTLIISEQLKFIQNKNLGYNNEQLLVIPQNINAGSFSDLFKNGTEKGRQLKEEILKIPEVSNASVSMHTFNQNGWMELGYKDEKNIMQFFNFNIVDETFLDTHGISLLQGRNFSEKISSDQKSALLINESMSKAFGWEVGERPTQFPDYEVIGIVKDFNFISLHSPVNPVMLAINPFGIFENISNHEGSTSIVPKVTLKLQTKNFEETLGKLKTVYNKIHPNDVFEFNFVDEALGQMYRKERQIAVILNYVTFLGLFIACLGLIGLITLVVNKRAKEFGIRKVFGAPIYSILIQISKEFVWIVITALLIATPITWWLMENWLMDFSYRIQIDPIIFLLTGFILLAITGVTISYQAIKAAKLNPVKSIKME